MKNCHYIVFFLSLVLGVFFVSCSPEKNTTSPLDGITVDDVIMEYNETTKEINLSKRMIEVSARATDLSTNQPAMWLNATVSGNKLTLRLNRNNTINDRSCRVTLYYDGVRTDLVDVDRVVEFTVTQRKNKIFDGLDIENVEVPAQQCDTVIVLDRRLENVKTDVTDMEGEHVDWCTVKIVTSALRIQVGEYKSRDSRQALIRLYPSGDNTSPDDEETAQVALLVTQHHNPVLDSLTIEPLTLDYEGTRQVVKTDRQLTNIRAQVIDEETHQKASWCRVSIAGDSITVKGDVLTTLSERSARVTLYLPNNNEVIDSTTLTNEFIVRQTHNTVFDESDIPRAILKYDQTRLVFKVKKPMKNIKALAVDSATVSTADWLTVTPQADSVVITAAVHKSLTHRVARVLLYYPNQGEPTDSSTVKTTFMVEQQHNTVFDNLTLPNHTILHNQRIDTFVVGREMRDIKCQIIDNKTSNSANWLSASVVGDAVIFRAQLNRETVDRSAHVTLYYPYQNNVVDSQTVRTSFEVCQKYNTVFDNLVLNDRTVAHDKAVDTFRINRNLEGIRYVIVDNKTGSTPSWLGASVISNGVVFRPQVNRGMEARSAHVTLYYPNSENLLDSQTVRTSFQFHQNYNTIFEDLGHDVEDRVLESNQLADTLTFHTELTDFKCKIVDIQTGSQAKWLTAQIEGEKVIFASTLNATKNSRSARVTLYYPNGNAPIENTIHSTFLVTQLYKKQITPEKTTISLPYNPVTTTFTVASNVKYEIVNKAEWVTCQMTPIDEYHEQIGITTLVENKDESVRKGSIILKSDELEVTINLEQRTNPAISFGDLDVSKKMLFTKGGGELTLPIITLTPDFEITKKSQWLRVDEKKRDGLGLYHCNVHVYSFGGEGPLRTDTIVVKNNERTEKFVIMQHKYVYLSNSEMEIEVGKSNNLSVTNFTNLPIIWQSSDSKIATVDNDGNVTALSRGTKQDPVTVQIEAYVNEYLDITHYGDKCSVTVFDVTDRIAVDRGFGNYQEDNKYVTSDSPIQITNNYYENVEIVSVSIVNEDGNIVSEGKVKDDNSITPQISSTLKPDESVVYEFDKKLNHVYKPQIHIQLMSNNTSYKKISNFFSGK